MSVSFDVFSEGVLSDPYPWYRWLRREAPCYHAVERDIWVVSRFDDVVAALRNHEAFSSTLGIGPERRPTRDMLTADPPEHTRLRRIVNRDFLPRAIAAFEPRVTAIVNGILDGILDKGAVDLVPELAAPLPIIVISEMLGVPTERQGDFKRWSDDLIDAAAGNFDEAALVRIKESRREFADFLRETAADRRQHPISGAGDLISGLVRASDTDTLTDNELIEFGMVLLVAGNETTTNAIGNGALAILAQPDPWSSIVADPTLVPSFVEEVLRFDSPIQGFFRNTLTPVAVAGTTIPADAKVLLLFGSANRDSHHYPDADTFLAARNPVDHVAFGSGIHHCLGAPLARLELTVLVSTFLRRVRAILPAGAVVRTRNPLFRGVRQLPVVVEPT